MPCCFTNATRSLFLFPLLFHLSMLTRITENISRNPSTQYFFVPRAINIKINCAECFFPFSLPSPDWRCLSLFQWSLSLNCVFISLLTWTLHHLMNTLELCVCANNLLSLSLSLLHKSLFTLHTQNHFECMTQQRGEYYPRHLCKKSYWDSLAAADKEGFTCFTC